MSEGSNTQPKISWGLGTTQMVITIVIGIFTFINTNNLSLLQAESQTIKNKQDTISFDQNIKLKIYDLTVKAIESDNPKQQSVALVAINNLLKDDKYKEGILDVIQDSPESSEGVKGAVSISKLKIRKDRKNDNSLSNKVKTYVEIIYYQPNEAQTKPIALKLYNALKYSTFYDVGIKPLTARTNAEKFYKITSNEIRYDKDEIRLAQTLQEVIGEVLPSEDLKVELKETAVGKATKYYLSLFIYDTDRKNE